MPAESAQNPLPAPPDQSPSLPGYLPTTDSVPHPIQPTRWNSRQGTGLAHQISNAAHLLRDLRIRMRFGELTRAPLRLLRLQLIEHAVECDWLARAPDPWDISLPRHQQQRHEGQQTLRDAIDIRDLIFHTFPQVQTARFRVYRVAVVHSNQSDQDREIILIGASERGDSLLRRVRSLAMQAKLLGFHFSLENGVLHKLPSEDPTPKSQSHP